MAIYLQARGQPPNKLGGFPTLDGCKICSHHFETMLETITFSILCWKIVSDPLGFLNSAVRIILIPTVLPFRGFRQPSTVVPPFMGADRGEKFPRLAPPTPGVAA